MLLLLTALGCFVVGLCIGWCGIAGFLLPILFVDYCGLDTRQSLFLSFSCFLLSGVIGAWNYHRRGDLPLKPALQLGVGSLAGGLAGALVGGSLEPGIVKTMLYLVVLLSGASILLRERCRGTEKMTMIGSPTVYLALGLVTGMICALSGAGGPVLVMPLLIALGVSPKQAVAMALLDSVFIALPAIAVYGMQSKPGQLLPILVISCIAHSLGVGLGSVSAGRVPAHWLKRGVAIFSICFSLVMLL